MTIEINIKLSHLILFNIYINYLSKSLLFIHISKRINLRRIHETKKIDVKF